MKIQCGSTPNDIVLHDGDYLTDLDPTDVVEIFQTPLTGTYNWDYTVQDNRVKKLYELGKQLNWNAETDVDWTPEFKEITDEEFDFENNQWSEHPVYKTWDTEKRKEFIKDLNAWSISQFLHGEQGALLVASQLASCAPTFNAKLYAASQTFDEARHVTFGVNYLEEFVQTLTEEERNDRAQFALEACTVSRNRLRAYDVWEKYGMDIEQTEAYQKEHIFQTQFQDVLFSRIMPNLKRIGLLTDELIPEYEKLGVMGYADGDSDYETSWEELSKPLKTT